MGLEWATKVVHSTPTFAPIYPVLAAAAAELDKDQVAENAITKFLELKPNATVTSVMDLFPATGTSFAGRYRAGFIKAGFSE